MAVSRNIMEPYHTRQPKHYAVFAAWADTVDRIRPSLIGTAADPYFFSRGRPCQALNAYVCLRTEFFLSLSIQGKCPSRIAIDSHQLRESNRIPARRNSQVPERVIALIDLLAAWKFNLVLPFHLTNYRHLAGVFIPIGSKHIALDLTWCASSHRHLAQGPLAVADISVFTA